MTKLSASILSFLLVIFIAALLSASIRGIDINCGCFLHSINRSDYDFSTLTGLYLALRDLLFLIPGMIVIFFKKNAKGIISPP